MQKSCSNTVKIDAREDNVTEGRRIVDQNYLDKSAGKDAAEENNKLFPLRKRKQSQLSSIDNPLNKDSTFNFKKSEIYAQSLLRGLSVQAIWTIILLKSRQVMSTSAVTEKDTFITQLILVVYTVLSLY